MVIHVFPDPEQASIHAAEFLHAQLGACRTLVVAGGHSPRRMYQQIAARRPDVSQLHVFTLDEYVGVPSGHPGTCAELLRREVAQAWGVPLTQYHSLNSEEPGVLESLNRHEKLLDALGGIDWAVLGLGLNGHVGFNEPGSGPDAESRLVDLEETSIQANARWFEGRFAPRRGVTMGLGRLLQARGVLLLAFGTAKADAVRAMVLEPPSPRCPASWLQNHPNVHVFLDQDAAHWLPPHLARAAT